MLSLASEKGAYHMPRIVLWLGAMPVMFLSLTACNPADPSTVAVTGQDAGNTVELRAGDILEVALVGNPSTGFGWYHQSLDTTIIEQKGDWEFTPDNSSPGSVGSSGTFTLRFEAVGSGQTTLQLIYHRPFEPDTPPAQTFEVTVVVSNR